MAEPKARKNWQAAVGAVRKKPPPLDKASARRLGASFQRNLVHKEYLAVVSGDVLASQSGRDFTVSARICEVDGDTSVRSTVQSDGCRSQEALTTMRVLGTSAGSSYSLLLAKPTTGRTHQIRVHCASIGHPLVADAPYKGAEHAEMPRQALHALRLRLPHPDGDAELRGGGAAGERAARAALDLSQKS